MVRKLIERLHQGKRGITGLETAIILIAFVVVASVFAYTVLSAGIFSSEKGKEAVHSGLETSRSSMELVGSVKALAQTATEIDDADDVWAAAANVTAATDTTDKKEGAASVELTIAAAFATGLVASEDLSAAPVDLSSHYTVRFWIKSSGALAANTLQLLLDNDSNTCASPEETLNIPALAANTWTRVHLKLTNPAGLDGVDCVGLNAAVDPNAVVVNIDNVEAPGEVDQVVLVVGNSLDGEAINLTTTLDADGDGLLSDEAVKNHVLTVDYVDQTQRVSDVTWTKVQRGRGDGDDLLEPGEKFEIVVNLEALNPLPVERVQFSLHLRPEKGSALIVERTIPGTVDAVMDLN